MFKSLQIADIPKHDAWLAVCLFSAANGALYVEKLGFKVRVRVSCRSGIPAASFREVIDFLAIDR